MLQTQHDRLDCLVRVVTPENVEFEYALAGPFQRLPAFLLDLLIRAIFLIGMFITLSIVTSFLPLGDSLSMTISILLVFILSWFYGAYFETRFNGQTLGKMAFRLRVISVDGRPINGVQSAIRNLLRLADLYPTPLVGLGSMLISDRFQRIGDLAAGTMVVLQRSHRTPHDIKPEDPQVFAIAELIPPTFVASHSMAQTISFYMENRKRLPVARRNEIAQNLAEPLLAQFGMPLTIGLDRLLCGVYVRLFMSEAQRATGRRQMRENLAADSAFVESLGGEPIVASIVEAELPPVVAQPARGN